MLYEFRTNIKICLLFFGFATLSFIVEFWIFVLITTKVNCLFVEIKRNFISFQFLNINRIINKRYGLIYTQTQKFTSWDLGRNTFMYEKCIPRPNIKFKKGFPFPSESTLKPNRCPLPPSSPPWPLLTIHKRSQTLKPRPTFIVSPPEKSGSSLP